MLLRCLVFNSALFFIVNPLFFAKKPSLLASGFLSEIIYGLDFLTYKISTYCNAINDLNLKTPIIFAVNAQRLTLDESLASQLHTPQYINPALIDCGVSYKQKLD